MDFEEIYRKYFREVYLFIQSLSHDESIAEEITQEVWRRSIMKEIKCTIIQNVLPLYIDEVVSQDTKKMVEGHLQHCDKCQKAYESMKSELYIPV